MRLKTIRMFLNQNFIKDAFYTEKLLIYFHKNNQPNVRFYDLLRLDIVILIRGQITH